MPFTQGEWQYQCKALSALCCCSISLDCLFSEECTQAEQLGVGTVLIENRESACAAGGQMVQAFILWSWQCELIISCACSTHTEAINANPQQAVQTRS